ncbi:MAG: hypothetical protein ACOY35_01555 [Bacillota bacterium]
MGACKKALPGQCFRDDCLLLQEPNQQYNNRYDQQEKKNAANNWQPVRCGTGFCVRHLINPFFVPIYERLVSIVILKDFLYKLNINNPAKMRQGC